MKLLKLSLVVVGSAGLIFLGACGNSSSDTKVDKTTVASPVEKVTKTEPSNEKISSNKDGIPSKGGQVIESGKYHLEFVPAKEADGTNLDFYLQTGDNHEAVSNAKVTAQIQLPDGTQKELPLPYDAAGKYYGALLPEKATGEYKVAVLSDINGEKVNGRFSFKR
ncbi:MAG: hypothetical protein U7123_08270 [Potamolinea sp.]